MELLPDTFKEIRKKHYEMKLDANNRKLLLSTFDYIIARKPIPKDTVKLAIGSGGEISIPGYTFLHVSKLPSKVLRALSDRSLIHLTAEKHLRKQCDISGFRIVERNACNVILALIAEYYGRKSGVRTVTDENLGYLAAVLNRSSVRRQDGAAMHLASVIMRIQVPTRIADLTPKEYVSLRKRYDDLRRPFQRSVRTLCDDYLLAGMDTRRQFDDAVRDAASEFSSGVDRMLKKSWAIRLGKWGPMSLGVVSTLCKFGSPVVTVLGTGVDIGLKIYGALNGPSPPTDIRAAQHLFATLRAEFASPLMMRRLVLR